MLSVVAWVVYTVSNSLSTKTYPENCLNLSYASTFPSYQQSWLWMFWGQGSLYLCIPQQDLFLKRQGNDWPGLLCCLITCLIHWFHAMDSVISEQPWSIHRERFESDTFVSFSCLNLSSGRAIIIFLCLMMIQKVPTALSNYNISRLRSWMLNMFVLI
jgi:hypothetical protein